MPRPVGTVIFALAASALLGVMALASGLYRGSGPVFAFFNVCFCVLVALAIPQPRAYGYTFLAAFLVLGFWLKVMVHAIAAPGFVEPTGEFAHSPAEWDSALIVTSWAVLGVVAARLAHLWLAHDAAPPTAGPPAWYVRWEAPVWVVTIVLILAVNSANLYFAFYQIGVRPRLLLPLRGHVLLAWLINVGFALWVAALTWWHYQRRGAVGWGLLLPAGESFLSATSAFSRMIFIVHALPYGLALYERRKDVLAATRRRSVYALVGAAAALLVVSVVTVFWLRVYYYYGYAVDAPGNEPYAQHVERTIYKQVPLLLVHRWVGLEGVLAVGAAERSLQRFREALLESPKSEAASLFQRTAKPAYLSEKPDQFVFLANAGPVAVFWFSGSLLLVFLGMVAIAAVMSATEEAARRWTANPFLLAVAGATLANVVSQTTFFYLTLIFLIQLWVALAFVGALQRFRLGNL